jgi:DNA modification methylase
MPLSAITPAPRNPKDHHGPAIRASIERFGLADLPVLDERTGRLVSGHGRLEQAQAMHAAGQTPPDGIDIDPATGEWRMPVVRGWRSPSDIEAAAYLVAANHTTTLGGWDDAGLAELLTELNDADPDLFAVTGFTDEDLAALVADEPDEGGGGGQGAEGDPDAVPPPPKDPVTKPGDVWLLGPHRISCGDCRDFNTVETLLAGARVNVAFTSPPYASQRTYDKSSGFQPIRPDGYSDWFENVQANVRAVLADDGSWFVNIKAHTEEGQRHLYVHDLTIAHVRRWGWRFVDELCWVDTGNGFPGGYVDRFKDAWESVFHYAPQKTIKFRPLANGETSEHAFKYSTASHRVMRPRGYVVEGGGPDVVDFYEGAARPSNVLRIAAGGGNGHAAAFPAALPAWFIRAYSDAGDTVFDPFMGSGSTLVAAHQEGRVAYGAEISPAYCDVICRRYQQLAGDLPVLAATGEPHDFTAGDDG